MEGPLIKKTIDASLAALADRGDLEPEEVARLRMMAATMPAAARQIMRQIEALGIARRAGRFVGNGWKEAKAAILVEIEEPVLEEKTKGRPASAILQRLFMLDRRWDVEREELMIHSRRGPRVPTAFDAYSGAITFPLIFGALILQVALRNPRDLPIWAVALAALAATASSVAAFRFGMRRARRYADAEARYRDERRKLREELKAAVR